MKVKVLFLLVLACSSALAQDVTEAPVESVAQEVITEGTAQSPQQPVVVQNELASDSPVPTQEPPVIVPEEASSTSAPAVPPVNPPPAGDVVVPQPEESQGEVNSNAGGVQNVEVESTSSPVAGGEDGEITVTAYVGTTPVPTTQTTSTTPAPTPPPTPKPVPAAEPSPFPKNVGNWSVKGTKSACILMTGALQIHLKGNNKTDGVTVNVPEKMDHVKLSGNCGADTQTIVLNWWSEEHKNNSEEDGSSLRNNTVTIQFSKETNGQYGLKSVSYQYHYKDVSVKGSGDVIGPFFLTNLEHSYRCSANQHVETDNSTLFLLTENLQFEAFRDDSREAKGTVEYNAPEECKADHHMSTGSVLAAGIGIALLVVIVVVLGVYLFKRCRRTGYVPLDSQG